MHETIVRMMMADLAGFEHVGVSDVQRAYGLGYKAARAIIDELVERGRLRRVYDLNAPRPWKVVEVKEVGGDGK